MRNPIKRIFAQFNAGRNDNSRIEPDLRQFFFIEKIKYAAFIIIGIAFGLTSRDPYLSLCFLGIAGFLAYERYSTYIEACEGNLIMIEGICQPNEQRQVMVLGQQIFGASSINLMANDGHLYIVPMTKFKKYGAGDLIRVYASPKNVSQRDEDTFFVSPFLYAKKLKNAETQKNQS